MLRLQFSENVNMALDAVWSHRFRSSLTILGIVIGITTVVTVGSLTSGLRAGIVTFFAEFGPNNIFLNRFNRDPSAPGSLKEMKRRPILPEYAAYIKQSVRAVEDVSLQLYVTSETSGLITARVPGFETENVSLVGYSGNAFNIQPREVKEGRVFTPEEAERGVRVCVIGPLVAEALYPDGRAVGRMVSVAGTEYTVVGVFTEAKGGFFGQNGQDTQIIIPYQTARQRFPTEDRLILVAQAYAGQRDEAFEEIRQLLRCLRHTPPGADDDFGLTTADQIINRLDGILSVIVIVSVALSSLGLLVGGIGVMNIMLVSVTERTKEIGIRKAIGARKGDIVAQFLMEAITLTGLGGALGVLVSVLLTLIIGKLVPSLPSSVPGWAISLGFGVSVSIGLFFGTWPALKAANLDPVDALRYE
ncbi:ABC transporter permease [uncultured Paludibaculum sp.]|uniref:ABC transporter permease n=1 Tax=uncultured Paludibaculum sp. TaxID=1765020 RepID=UPI002AABF68A|nr:ABC transporter permease [uncultured Paludibaculum sp.]